jgi:5-deoxy-glucuronate isomerase
MTATALHRPAASLVDGGWTVDLDPAKAGWRYTGLRVVDLPPGGSAAVETGDDEVIVLPLSGAVVVECDGEKAELAGRSGVFDAVTDFAYAPRDSMVTLTSVGGGRFALPAARARRRLPFRRVAASDVGVEMRGAGSSSRQVNNFATPDVLDADRIIACEVLTPAGNWSSYPPHKHDQDRGQAESALEEIYYFEVVQDGPAYQRVYTSGPGRDIDVCAEVSSGDVVLIPFGYHGPSMAAPGYDLYYLNVMAGPGERVWRFCDDPAHAWLRDTWASQPIDPRLPLTSAGGHA